MGRKEEERINKLVFGDIEMPEEVLSFGRLISKYFLPRTKWYGALPDEAFRKLGIPMLYITGEDNKLLPSKKDAQRMKSLVPYADIRVLADRPHALIGLADEIIAFIETKGIQR